MPIFVVVQNVVFCCDSQYNKIPVIDNQCVVCEIVVFCCIMPVGCVFHHPDWQINTFGILANIPS